MNGKPEGDKVVLQCPECGVRVETTVQEVAKGKVQCPRAHEFEVMGILDGLEGPDAPI